MRERLRKGEMYVRIAWCIASLENITAFTSSSVMEKYNKHWSRRSKSNVSANIANLMAATGGVWRIGRRGRQTLYQADRGLLKKFVGGSSIQMPEQVSLFEDDDNVNSTHTVVDEGFERGEMTTDGAAVEDPAQWAVLADTSAVEEAPLSASQARAFLAGVVCGAALVAASVFVAVGFFTLGG